MSVIEPVTAGDQLRQAFGCFPSGVTAVCAEVDGVPVGLAASSFTSVSIDPPLVSVCMQHSSTTWPTLRERPRIGLSVLAEGQDDACGRLASKSGDRFAGTATTVADDGALFVDGATLWLDCTIHAEVPSGDHDIVLLNVHGIRADPATPPLVFHGSRFRRLAAI
ncbi:flavin reductase family protein [Pseudonocardia parietis]|uniref:Flavin reductase (DIM6/NTAB) family NADH-FMN oxidoreductase RutF n=1 Tax=Pseudonocardia parietis TaxID=570936 RepID=A0ABS4VRE2_9PSEU|nr:flavin reductase family protein [Pseudonocardia parietis]MBP2366481.1 flavin reductase (DIM6/NTAB) family NADH-FMN oxidoreductase RutF [Pseudonocardia parietis]